MAQEKILINEKIVGILSYPNNLDGQKLPAVLLLHGFATDKNEVNSIYKEMASMLESRNILNLRIDFSGFGESGDNSENASIDTMIADAKGAFEYLSLLPFVNTDAIGMVGFSLGAAIAMLTTEQTPCQSLAIVSPASDLVKDFTAFLGQKVMDDLSHCEKFVEIELPWRKIKIGKEFYNSLFKYNPLKSIHDFCAPLFCIAGENDFSAANAENVYEKSRTQNKSLHIIQGADHILSNPNGESKLKNAASEICAWLQENLLPSKCIKDNSSALCK